MRPLLVWKIPEIRWWEVCVFSSQKLQKSSKCQQVMSKFPKSGRLYAHRENVFSRRFASFPVSEKNLKIVLWCHVWGQFSRQRMAIISTYRQSSKRPMRPLIVWKIPEIRWWEVCDFSSQKLQKSSKCQQVVLKFPKSGRLLHVGETCFLDVSDHFLSIGTYFTSSIFRSLIMAPGLKFFSKSLPPFPFPSPTLTSHSPAFPSLPLPSLPWPPIPSRVGAWTLPSPQFSLTESLFCRFW